jgi:hypothetical protein
MNEAIQSITESLKGSPIVIAMILLNVLFIGGALLYLRAEQAQMDRVLAACLQGNKL